MDNLTFVASKLIDALVQPGTLLIALLVAVLAALWSGYLRLARVGLAIVLAAMGTLAVLPLGALLLQPLDGAFPVQPEVQAPAGIIVLGGGEDPDRSRAWGAPNVNEAGDRILAGIQLARRFPEAQVIYTGGRGDLRRGGPTEAGVAARILRRAGIGDDRLRFEPRARNTVENAVLTRELVGPGEPGPWILVTSAFHMPRAVASFCAAGWNGLVPWPTDHRTARFRDEIGWDFSGHLAALATGLAEWTALVAYRVAGYTEGLFESSCVRR